MAHAKQPWVAVASLFRALWEQAAAQGISVMVSTGDNGAAGCDDPGGPAQNGLNVNGLASTPWNVAVGGTDFDQFTNPSTYWNSTNDPITQASAKGHIPETTWNQFLHQSLVPISDGRYHQSGNQLQQPELFRFSRQHGRRRRRCSIVWAKPAGNTGTPNDSARDLPTFRCSPATVSWEVSTYLQRMYRRNCDLNDLLGYGGTSVASPAFAGIMALVNQKMG